MSKLLKKQREDTGTDISEVAARTRIKVSCLRSIENEDYDKLPIEVYTRGYIKEYAKYLAMPVESALAPYEKYLEMKQGIKGKKQDIIPAVTGKVTEKDEQRDQQIVSRQEEHGPVINEEVKTQTESPSIESDREEDRARRNRFIWKGFLLLLVVLAIIYQFFSSRNAEKEIRYVPLSSEAPAQKEQALKPEVPVVPANVPISEEIKIPERKKHQLEISANDTTWIQVVMDGAEKKEAVMNQGDAAIYEANETISIIVGNGAGVIIKFDGKELPSAKKGEVLKLTLPEKKSRAPQSEPAGQSLKKIPKPSVPARPDGPDQSSKDNAPFSPSSEKPSGTSQP
jgi:cytoskeletal protein RodZ